MGVKGKQRAKWSELWCPNLSDQRTSPVDPLVGNGYQTVEKGRVAKEK